MDIANIGSCSQSGDGMSWYSISNILTEDSQYAYSKINGKNKGTSKPKTITFNDCNFDIGSFDNTAQELVVEYKMYVDEGANHQTMDKFSFVRRPRITFTFFDGYKIEISNVGSFCDGKYSKIGWSQYGNPIDEVKYLSDYFNTETITKRLLVIGEINTARLKNPFSVSFSFDGIDSVEDNETIIMIDYVKFNVVNQKYPSEQNAYRFTFQGATIDLLGAKNYPRFYSDVKDSVSNSSDYKLSFRTHNLFEDEVIYVFLDGLTSNSEVGIVIENGYLDWVSNVFAKIVPTSTANDCIAKCTINSAKKGNCNVTVTTNYELESFIQRLESTNATGEDTDIYTNVFGTGDKKFVKSAYRVDVVVGKGANSFTLVPNKNNHFLFETLATELGLTDDISYIGSVRLHRGHDASVTNNTSNSLIEEKYQNRAYYGKKGDWDEEISMKLRLPWQDVVTLQNHTYHDAPIPIDIYPHLPHGDPLNHRGWAEIYEVANIKKINDMLYECEPKVKYLTHDLIGRFNIEQLSKVCPTEIDYNLTSVHQYTDDLRDKFALSYYKNFYNLEIDEDKYKGVYTVDSNSTFTFKTIEPVKSIADYSFRWRNILMALDSQAHDNPHWEMAFRVLNHETGQMLFEYLYYNFKHYNDSTDELLNECDVKVTSLNANGEYDVTNYTRMNLDFDDVSAVAYEDKSNTSFRIQSDIEVTSRGDNITFQLIDWNGQGVANAEVIIDFFNDYDEVVDSRSTVTQTTGYANFEFNQNNGNYKVRYRFLGNDTYNECYAESTVTVSLQTSTSTLFDIDDNQLFTTNTDKFRGHLQTASNVALPNKTVYIYLRTGKTGAWKSTPYIRVTDANGDFGLDIRLKTGLYQLKTVFYGDSLYDRCEEISDIRVNIGKGAVTKLSTTDMHISSSTTRDSNKFYAVLTDENNNPIANQKITFTCYNNMWKNVSTYERTTDSYGKCYLGINWSESGVYTIDTSYDGIENKYTPCNNTNTIFVEAQGKQLTKITMNDLVINDCNHHELYATLESENGELLINYPIRFDITYPNGHTITYTHLTNKYGVAELNINLATNKYNVKATFTDTDNYKGSVAKCNLTVNRPSTKWEVRHDINRLTYDGSRDITVTFTDKEGTAISGLPVAVELFGANYEPVSFNIVQTSDSAEFTSDLNGQFSFRPLVESGDYILHITNYCYGSYGVGQSDWAVHIDNGAKLGTQIVPTWSGDFTTHTVATGEVSDYATVYLKDENGYPLANKTIHYIFDGTGDWDYHDYIRTTDEYGKCSLPFRQQYTKARSKMVISFDGDEGYSSSEYVTYVVVDRDSSPSAVDPSIYTPCEIELLSDYTTEQGIKKASVTEFPSYFQIRLVNLDTSRAIANKTVVFTVTGENNERATYNRTTNQDGIATLEFTTHTNNTYPISVDVVDNVLSAESLYFEAVVNVKAEDTIDNIDNQAVISRDGIAQGLTILETPNPVGYDGAEYGSTFDMYFNNNVLEIHDYGLAQDTQYLSGKINRDNIILPSDCEYDIEVATSYNDALDNLVGDLTGTMQVRIYEILSLEQYKKLYSDLFVSPSPLLEYQCIFTRNGEDGKQYYYDGTSSNVTKRYRLSPFLQYKGGVNLETESGISLFNIENAHSPIIVNNGLIKLAFHRRSGFVYLYKYNYSTYQNGNDYIDNSSWVLVRTMKIKDYDNFTLDNYTSDKVVMTFGNSTFTMWRGRPFVEVKHPNQDIEFLKQVDTVFCEVNRNQFNLAMVDELDVDKAEAEFRTNNGLNLFDYDMGLNEDMNINSFGNSANMKKEIVRGTDDEFEIKGTVKASSNTNYIEFPQQRVLKPNGLVTLLIDRFKATANTVSISVVGYSKVDSKVGVFGETKTVTGILHDGTTNRVRMTFDLSSFNYDYIAFAVNLNNESADKYVQMSRFMLSEGDVELDYERDDTKYRYDGTTIYFDNNYYANFYNKSDDYGLCVCRPYFDSINIGTITASPLTVLIPYMKKDKDYNSPSRMIAEYLFFKDQVCKLLGENYGI